MSSAIKGELMNLRAKEEITARDRNRLRAFVERLVGVTETQALSLLEDGVAASIKAGSMGFGATTRVAEARALVDDNLAKTLAEIQAQRTADGMAYIRAANQTIGRQVDDILRRIALEQVKKTMDNNRDTAQTARGIRDEIFEAPAQGALRDIEGERFVVDKRGRKWQPKHYARMVARTTTREAMSEAFLARAAHEGEDLIRVSSHPDGQADPICVPFEGKLFSLSGRTPGLPVLERRPPFHPNCRHVLIPPTLDDKEKYAPGGAA